MKSIGFDASRFYAALDETRRARRLQWRQVAQQSGVSASTLTRMAQGKRPDVDGLAALSQWAGLDADTFFDGEKQPADGLNEVLSYLRADPNLTSDQADSLSAILRGAYELARKKHAF